MLYIKKEDSLIKYFKDLEDNDCSPKSITEEKILFLKIKEGDINAKNSIILSNLRFVVSCAMKYQNLKIPLNELISEGNIGLIRAIDKFDIGRDVKFFSYSVWWIRQAMQDYVNNYFKNNREIINPIKDDLNFDGVLNFIEILDNDHENDDDLLNDKDIISKILLTLNKRERTIIELYYGINQESVMTLDEIGEKMDLTKTRIMQIKKIAMNKLRSNILLYNDYNNIYK